MRKAILFLTSFFFTLSTLFGAVIYVDKNATSGNNNGTSWQHAFTDLGVAINSATVGDDIRITVGIYAYNNLSYTINKNITMTGGFDGFETGSTPNNPIENLDVNDPNSSTMINGGGNQAFLTIDGTTANGSITNSTIIQNINFQSNGSKDYGIKIEGANTNQSASPTIKDCRFSSFRQAAISVNGVNGNVYPTIENCDFSYNGYNSVATFTDSGSALFIDATNSNSSITIRDSKFNNNKVKESGGAIYSKGCDYLYLLDCNFANNEVDNGSGGALWVFDCLFLGITNTNFTENKAGNTGGAMYLQGADLTASATISDCIFSQNTATNFGGVFYNFYVNTTINRCKFYDNTAPSGGGAFLQANAGGTIQNCVFKGNNGGNNGNATYSFYNESDVISQPFTLGFQNCSFSENKNTNNVGNACYLNHTGTGSSNTFDNCILWDNGSSEILPTGNATATLNYSILDDSNINGTVQLPTNVSGSNNLDSDPLFTNDSLVIDCMSPAVDRGNTSVSVGAMDIAGNNRKASPFLVSNYIDIGAFEVQTITGGVDFDFDGLANDCDNCENKPNPAINFDGTDDYMNAVIDEFGTGNQVHTIEAWVYIDELPNFRSWPLHLGQYDFASHHWLIEADGDFVVGKFSGAQLIFSVPVQEWTHIATVFDGANLWVYKNGVAQGQTAVNFNFTNKELHLGKKRVSENDFNGSIDEVRIWNVARTTQQLAANSYRELRGNEAGLIAYYDFNEGMPNENNANLNTIPDMSGNGNTGTLNNFAKTGTSSNWVIGAPVIHRDLDGNGYGDICECDPMTAGTPCDDLDANTYNDVLDAACHCAGIPFSEGCVSGDTEQFGVEGSLNISFTTKNALSCTGGELTAEAHITYKQYLMDDWFVFEGLACNEDTPILIRRPKRLRDNAASARNNYDYCFMETWEIENTTCVTDILTISVYVYREEVIHTNLLVNQNPIPQNLYLADNQITSQGSISANDTVHFVAGVSIILNPGFNAVSGSTFSAKIKTTPTCNNQRVITDFPSTNILEKEATTALPLMNIYPNPASTNVIIDYQLPAPTKINLSLYNLAGQFLSTLEGSELQESGNYNFEININDYPKGIYFIRLQTAQTQIIEKLVIQ